MQKKAGFVRGTIFTVLVVGLASCVTQYRNHGYIPIQEELDQIKVGRDNKETVEQVFGPPAVRGIGEDNSWYYVESRFETYAYREPKEVERGLMAVSFSNSGLVSNIETFTLEDGEVVVLSRRVTPTPGRDFSFIRQLLGNVGAAPLGDLLDNP